jgi:hypothetical protein
LIGPLVDEPELLAENAMIEGEGDVEGKLLSSPPASDSNPLSVSKSSSISWKVMSETIILDSDADTEGTNLVAESGFPLLDASIESIGERLDGEAEANGETLYSFV